MLPKLRKSLLMNRLEHGTNPNYKYIVSDNPEIGCDEAIERSMAMMRGHKMRLFLMQLGMIGWSLLSLLTLGIAMLWIVPYYQTVFANFYLEIKAEYEAAGNAA